MHWLSQLICFTYMYHHSSTHIPKYPGLNTSSNLGGVNYKENNPDMAIQHFLESQLIHISNSRGTPPPYQSTADTSKHLNLASSEHVLNTTPADVERTYLALHS